MEFVQKFIPLDFQVKNFTPSILPNFNSFSKKKTQKMSENGEIYTAGKNFTLPPALTGWTNSTSVLCEMYLTIQDQMLIQYVLITILESWWEFRWWSSTIAISRNQYMNIYTNSLQSNLFCKPNYHWLQITSIHLGSIFFSKTKLDMVWCWIYFLYVWFASYIQ